MPKRQTSSAVPKAKRSRANNNRNALQHDSSVEQPTPSAQFDIEQHRASLKRKLDELYATSLTIQDQLEVLAREEAQSKTSRMSSLDTDNSEKITATPTCFNRIPPKFYGTEDYLVWWAEINVYFQQFPHLTEADKTRILNSCVLGSARMILDSAGPF